MKIKGKISKDGAVDLEVSGVPGDGCLDWTEKLRFALEGEAEIRETDEMHDEAEEAEVAREGGS